MELYGVGCTMTWWLLAAFLINWTSTYSTEQLAAYSSRQAIRKLFPSRSVSVRVLNYEDRIVKDAIVWEGTKVTITCKVHGLSKGTRLSWTEPSGETTRPTQYGIKIKKVFNRITQSNSGRYICNANDAEQDSYVPGSVHLHVEAAPTIRTNNVTALEGKHAVLRCTGSDHTNSYSISWLYEGKILQSDANIQISALAKHTQLTIHRVHLRHSGTYECRVTIGRVKISAYPQLTVVYPPEILGGPSNVTANVGATVTFHCNVTGSPEPNVTWELNGMPLDTSNASTSQGRYNQSSDKMMHVLTIKDIQHKRDSGLYSCRVHNKYGMPLFQSAVLQIQGPPSPPNVEVKAIYGHGTTLFAALNWTEPTHDGNSPITAYQLECKMKGQDKFYTRHKDSGIFFGEIPCAFLNQFNHSLPFVLDLVVRVLASNTIGVTSSNLLNLTVELVASKNNRSAFEAVMPSSISPSTVPTLANVISTIQPSSSPDSPNSSQKHHSHSSLPTSSAKTPKSTSLYEDSTSDPSYLLSGDSDDITTGTSYLLSKTEPITMRKESNTGTTPQLTVQVVAEPASNWTDLEEKNGAGSEGMNTLQHIGVSVAVLVVVLAFLLIAGFIYRQKHSRSERSGVEQVTRPQHRQPSTAEDSTSVQVSNELSETHADSDAEGCSAILDETDVYSFCGSSLEVKVGPDGGDFQSGSLLVSVPSEAVSSEQQIQVRFLFNMEPIPIPENWSVVSPILSLQPHGLSFQKPVSIWFPFTLTSDELILELMKEQDEGWKSVLTIDGETEQVIYRDSHCNYDVNTNRLVLSHFCKYDWCCHNKENSSSLKKTIVCSLFARMDSSGNSCNFFLYLGDDCEDITKGVLQKESDKSKEAFQLKDSDKIVISKTGTLKIQCTGKGFELIEKNDAVTVELRDLWPKTFGILKRLLIPAKRTKRLDGSNDLELCATITTSARSQDPIHVLAVFDESERRVQTSQSSLGSSASGTQKCHFKSDVSPSLPSSKSAHCDNGDTLRRSFLDSSYHTESDNSNVVDGPNHDSAPSWRQSGSSDIERLTQSQRVLQNHWKELMNRLNSDHVTATLFQEKVLSDQDLQNVIAEKTSHRKAEVLLLRIWRSSDKDIRLFAKALSQTAGINDLGARLLKDLQSLDDATVRPCSTSF